MVEKDADALPVARPWSTRESQGEIKDFDAAFDRAFGLVAFAINRHLIDHMLRALRELEVDFESLVIWGILSHLNVMHLLPPGSAPGSLLNDEGRLRQDPNEIREVRLRDLEQITGMARETVRRKLLKLEKLGFVVRRNRGWTYNAESLDPRLRDFTRESTRRLLAASDEVMRLLISGERCAHSASPTHLDPIDIASKSALVSP